MGNIFAAPPGCQEISGVLWNARVKSFKYKRALQYPLHHVNSVALPSTLPISWVLGRDSYNCTDHFADSSE